MRPANPQITSPGHKNLTHRKSHEHKAVCGKSACEVWLNKKQTNKKKTMERANCVKHASHFLCKNPHLIAAMLQPYPPHSWAESLHLGLSRHAEMQPGNPYVFHLQHYRRGEGMLEFLSCSDHPEQELWMSGRRSADRRDIGFARC